MNNQGLSKSCGPFPVVKTLAEAKEVWLRGGVVEIDVTELSPETAEQLRYEMNVFLASEYQKIRKAAH